MPHFNGIVITLTIAFLLFYIADILLTLRNEHEIVKARERWKKTAPFMPVHYRELGAYSFMCLSAGICEEVLFRGFLVTYVQTFFIDNPYGEIYAAIIPALVFAAGHYYQGWQAVLKTVVLSALFGFIFLYSGSLWIVIILHFAIDLAGGLLSIRYLTRDEQNLKEEIEENELIEDSHDEENMERGTDQNKNSAET
jgi:membrane protease YdiL (CAAX protease family)